MNEAETRAEHIDPALKAASWGVVEGSRMPRELILVLVKRACATVNTEPGALYGLIAR